MEKTKFNRVAEDKQQLQQFAEETIDSINDIEEVVGDSTSGLVKDVADLGTDVEELAAKSFVGVFKESADLDVGEFYQSGNLFKINLSSYPGGLYILEGTGIVNIKKYGTNLQSCNIQAYSRGIIFTGSFSSSSGILTCKEKHITSLYRHNFTMSNIQFDLISSYSGAYTYLPHYSEYSAVIKGYIFYNSDWMDILSIRQIGRDTYRIFYLADFDATGVCYVDVEEVAFSTADTVTAV